jgi:hypothetical protein
LTVPDLGLKFTKINVQDSEQDKVSDRDMADKTAQKEVFEAPSFEKCLGLSRMKGQIRNQVPDKDKRKRQDSDEAMLGCDEDPQQIGKPVEVMETEPLKT